MKAFAAVTTWWRRQNDADRFFAFFLGCIVAVLAVTCWSLSNLAEATTRGYEAMLAWDAACRRDGGDVKALTRDRLCLDSEGRIKHIR